jgi:hypothetical protein
MPEVQTRDVIVRAVLTNCCGSLLRLLGDVERFGLRLKTLVLAQEDDELPVANVCLSIPCGMDASSIAARFTRHPEIVAVEFIRADACQQRFRTSASSSRH